jgi:hypothetical protein
MRLLIPSGKDRDKLIALKRGICYHEGAFSCKNCEQKSMDGIWRQNKKYSTNRNDARELWDDLPSPKSYHQFGNVHIVMVLLNNFSEEIKEMSEVSFADAVSKAWLQWYYYKWLQKHYNKWRQYACKRQSHKGLFGLQ